MSDSLTAVQADNLRRALDAYEEHRARCRFCYRAARHGVRAGELCRIERELFRVVQLRYDPDPDRGFRTEVLRHGARPPAKEAHADAT